ncbi:unnamed protein product, partial [Musa hybrid cultivar]
QLSTSLCSCSKKDPFSSFQQCATLLLQLDLSNYFSRFTSKLTSQDKICSSHIFHAEDFRL